MKEFLKRNAFVVPAVAGTFVIADIGGSLRGLALGVCFGLVAILAKEWG